MRASGAQRRPTPSARSALLCLFLLLPLSGCTTQTEATVTVLAAASLTEPFERLADRFEEDHPGVVVRLAFDSSATLAQQAVEGAPADVLATADQETMQQAASVLSDPPRVFATNGLVLVTPAGNPAAVTGVEDLERTDVTWVACVETAPCGSLARTMLDLHRVESEPASLEVDVKAVLAKVASDEADAGLVYESDVVAAGNAVERLPIPGTREHRTRYSIAALEQSEHPALGRAFVDLVRSREGQTALTEAGFSTTSAGDSR